MKKDEKKDEKKDDKHALVIVVGTGGPKKPEKTADPNMKKAWTFLKDERRIVVPDVEQSLPPPKTAEEYQRERNRKELGLGPDPDTSIPEKGTLTGTLANRTGTPRIVVPQVTHIPSGQLEAKENLQSFPTNEIDFNKFNPRNHF